MAADASWLLLGDTPDLSDETKAVQKRLYPQRLFGLALPKIKAVVDKREGPTNNAGGTSSLFTKACNVSDSTAFSPMFEKYQCQILIYAFFRD